MVCPVRQARRVLDIVAQDCMFAALKAAADAKGMTFVNKSLPGPVAPGPCQTCVRDKPETAAYR